MITEIKTGDIVLALIIDISSIKEGTFPVTDSSWSLQLLLMRRKRGHVVVKHMHKKIQKISNQPQEAIVVVRGAIEASIFDRMGKIIAKRKISTGQCLLLVDGGHEIKILKNALIYAFKDGPYVEDKIFL